MTRVLCTSLDWSIKIHGLGETRPINREDDQGIYLYLLAAAISGLRPEPVTPKPYALVTVMRAHKVHKAWSNCEQSNQPGNEDLRSRVSLLSYHRHLIALRRIQHPPLSIGQVSVEREAIRKELVCFATVF